MNYDYIASEGIWQIDADAAPTGGSYNIDLWFNDGGSGTFANLIDNQFAPLKRPSASTNASDWTAIGGTHNATLVADGYAERLGWSSFSQYGIGYKETPLPVELLIFSAEYDGTLVNLNWITASEVNNDYFLVQKSQDVNNFTNIGKVLTLAPNGNSSYLINYSLKDPAVNSGTYYYRLQQFDLDGHFVYSNIASIVIGESGIFSVTPNPAVSEIDIKYFCFHDNSPELKILDERGRIVYSKSIDCIVGSNTTVVDISYLKPAVYIIVLITKDDVQRVKLVKQ